MFGPLAAIVICCGPGLSGCANSGVPSDFAAAPEQHEWVWQSPGTLALSGTELIITYSAGTDTFTISGDGISRSSSDLADAVDEADDLVDRMELVGIKP